MRVNLTSQSSDFEIVYPKTKPEFIGLQLHAGVYLGAV